MALFSGYGLQAQFSLNVNFGPPPPWGPAGYASVRYYYLPDVEAYYDVQSAQFIYFGGGTWVHRSSLPSRYKNYDLYGGYKVVMKDYHGNAPYHDFKSHQKRYGKGYHGDTQRTNKEKPGGKYDYHQSGNNNGNNDSHGDKHNDDKGHDHRNGKIK